MEQHHLDDSLYAAEIKRRLEDGGIPVSVLNELALSMAHPRGCRCNACRVLWALVYDQRDQVFGDIPCPFSLDDLAPLMPNRKLLETYPAICFKCGLKRQEGPSINMLTGWNHGGFQCPGCGTLQESRIYPNLDGDHMVSSPVSGEMEHLGRRIEKLRKLGDMVEDMPEEPRLTISFLGNSESSQLNVTGKDDLPEEALGEIKATLQEMTKRVQEIADRYRKPRKGDAPSDAPSCAPEQRASGVEGWVRALRKRLGRV